MLTADLVRATRRKGKLTITKWKKGDREEAAEIGERLIEATKASVGKTRGEHAEALSGVMAGPRKVKLVAGLRKLIEDRCEFEQVSEVSPVALRKRVFEEAALRRREARFDREALLMEIATKHETSIETIERWMVADLRDEQRLLSFDALSGAALVDIYDQSSMQAVLLRAETLVAQVHCKDPSMIRTLFRKLKFFQLLFEINALSGAGTYRITLSGPMSLFRSSTKYGLKLALALPWIQACDRWAIDAQLRWGKDRSRVVFAAEGRSRVNNERDTSADYEDPIATLMAKQQKRVDKGTSEWTPEPCTEVFNLPGVGVCVPDLVFTKGEARVYFEALGFWSRDAVWKRVELAESGLDVPMVFACSKRLRVSEEVLGDDVPAALYVYKGVMSPAQIDQCLDEAWARYSA